MADTIEVYAEQDSSGFSSLYEQRYDADHKPIGDPIQLTPDSLDATDPQVTLLDNGNFQVTFFGISFDHGGDERNTIWTAEFTPDGQVYSAEEVGPNTDYGSDSTTFHGIALGGGAFAGISETVHGYDGEGARVTQTLHYVDAGGHITDTLLFDNEEDFDPYPQLRQEDATIVRNADGGFTVSLLVDSIQNDPQYPAIGGSESFTEVYDANGQLIRSVFIGFHHATDLVQSRLSTVLSPTLHNLTLIGTGNLTARGNALANTIIGNDARDHITGEGGDDRLDGGLGSDYLAGGAGADTFVFDSAIAPRWNSDTIGDFAHGVDHLELSRSIFAGLAAGTLSSALFSDASAGPVNPDARIIYDAGGNLLYDPDGAGSAHAVQFATLSGHPHLTAADIIVV